MGNGSMVKHVQQRDMDDAILLNAISKGDCKNLSESQKIEYYRARCDAAGLDYRTTPFQFISVQGKTVLYATKAASDQLTAKHGIKLTILGQTTENGIRLVTARAVTKDGRETEDVGAVSVVNLKGDDLCNAFMKAVTKAKRRAILSVCGLGMLDETEIETIPVITYGEAAHNIEAHTPPGAVGSPEAITAEQPPQVEATEEPPEPEPEPEPTEQPAQAAYPDPPTGTNVERAKAYGKMLGEAEVPRPQAAVKQYVLVLAQKPTIKDIDAKQFSSILGVLDANMKKGGIERVKEVIVGALLEAKGSK